MISELLKNNPLKTRDDMKKAVLDICEPLKAHFSPKKAFLDLGATSAAYGDETAMIEAFSRPLWALAPLFSDGTGDEWAAIYREGFIAGTDPESDEYWGESGHHDQKLVEMAAMGLALILAPEKIWDPLTDKQKDNLYNWLDLVNYRKAWECNWVLFAVMVNLGFKRVGRPYNAEVVKKAFDTVETFYLGDGWYQDGVNAHTDYYLPFAIYFYSLIYAKQMENEDVEFCKEIKNRAKTYAKEFIYWFSPDGSAIPHGRSMTYRFAQCAFWSAYAYAEVDGYEPGVVKGIILRHLRSWFARPIFDKAGILTIGHGYPSLIMTEGYNAPGSPYWALKSFLVLALPESHPFWTCEELPLPELDSVHAMPKAHLIAARDGNHVALFNAGYPYTNTHTHCGAKYEKFAYSNLHGFSTPKAEWGLGQGAFDSALALSEKDNCYRIKRLCKEYEVFDNYLYTKWAPWNDVTVETYVVASLPWSVKIHKVTTERNLDASDGGFAFNRSLPTEWKREKDTAYGVQKDMVTGVALIKGEGSCDIIGTESNTNLLFSRAAIPSVRFNLEKGVHTIATAVYSSTKEAEFVPALEETETEYIVTIGDKVYTIKK
ncbi:MAG: DUF2264 domain-containing protein [Clostridia bacterium]|nr:DUF2264 domain-containing protein [Clostridia bacterium]